MILLRAYGLKTGDYQMVDGWWRARHRVPFPENLLPGLGVVAERDGEGAAALWAYQSAGIGVALLEYAITRPGQSWAQARESLGRAFEGVLLCLKMSHYSVARCFCSRPMERALRSWGFVGIDGNLSITF